jgi:hypothetical protein
MFTGLRNAVRHLRRDPRPVLAALLVLAQALAAVGSPAVVRPGESLRPCGCKVHGPNVACCCAAGACCAVIPEPEPEPPACPKCREKEVPKPVAIRWVNAASARQCRGDSPLGPTADTPAVPPAVAAAVAFAPPPADSLRPTDQFATSFTSTPPEPPPRG